MLKRNLSRTLSDSDTDTAEDIPKQEEEEIEKPRSRKRKQSPVMPEGAAKRGRSELTELTAVQKLEAFNKRNRESVARCRAKKKLELEEERSRQGKCPHCNHPQPLCLIKIER